MAGVIDDRGQQWEHCHTCNDFVRFPQNLGYTEGYKAHICISCANKLPQEQLETVIKAPSWRLICRPFSKVFSKEVHGSR
jgi:hypothetical protein